MKRSSFKTNGHLFDESKPRGFRLQDGIRRGSSVLSYFVERAVPGVLLCFFALFQFIWFDVPSTDARLAGSEETLILPQKDVLAKHHLRRIRPEGNGHLLPRHYPPVDGFYFQILFLYMSAF